MQVDAVKPTPLVKLESDILQVLLCLHGVKRFFIVFGLKPTLNNTGCAGFNC